MKILFFTFLLVITFIKSYTQRSSMDFLPKVISASPEASAIAKFTSYAVNMSSGVPNISIPIYNIDVNGMTVPITLDYHASGYRVTDQAGWVGLGWTLFAGGAITRNIMGLSDERNGYLNGTYEIKTAGFDYEEYLNTLRMFYQNQWDAEPDIYSYSFPGLSGKFYYANRDKDQPRLIPYNAIKINTSINNYALSFNILDEKGIEYVLGNYAETSFGNLQPSAVITSWPLSKMISANKKDTIEFFYSDNSYPSVGDVLDYVHVVDGIHGAAEANSYHFAGRYQPSITATSSSSSSLVSGLTVREIRFRNGKVVFEKKSTNRLDVTSTHALNRVLIYSKDVSSGNYSLIKSVQLNTSYFFRNSSNTTPFHLRLDEVEFQDKNNQAVHKYKIEYNQDISIGNGIVDLKARDYWGYFNNKNNSSLVPQQNIQILGPGGVRSTTEWIGSDIANGREPDPDYNQIYILKKITLPTGGFTEFDYETNMYHDFPSNSTKYGGGLRVSQIRSYASAGNLASKKTYTYGPDGNGKGSIIIPLANRFFNTEQEESPCYGANFYYCRVRNYVSVPSVNEPFDGNSVGYEYVTEYEGDQTNNNGKTVYQYSFIQDGFTSFYQYNKPNVVSYHYKRGLLTHQTTYRRNEDGTYKKLRNIYNEYGAFPDNSVGAVNLVIFEAIIYDDATYCISYDPGMIKSPEFIWNGYSVTSGDNKLIKSTETTYNMLDESELEQITTYSYSEKHHQVTVIKTSSCKGDELISENKYPEDFKSDSELGTISTLMIQANMLSYPIEQASLIKKNNVTSLLKASKTKYKNWGNSIISPELVYTKTLNLPYEPRVQFYSYDLKGNVTSVRKTSDVKYSYLWDYNLTYPTAEIINAFPDAVAYTSFETTNYGGWTIHPGGTILANNNNITGTKSFSGNITANVPSGNYTLSFWSAGDTWINGLLVTAAPNKTLGPWRRYYEVKLSNINSVNVAANNIDEVRLYPEGAQLSTYTYTPLVGMTSKCDLNNNITYYEYDKFNRLFIVLDERKNILKKICYNYSGQIDVCGVFSSTDQSGNYLSQNCTSDQTPQPYYVSIPSGMFTSDISLSDANTKAQAYGMAQANQYGTCLTPALFTLNYSNYTQASDYIVSLYNTTTSQNYNFSLGANGSGSLGQIPEGTYNITITSTTDNTNLRSYEFGCDFYTSGYGNSSISNVSLSAFCNSIEIYSF